MLNRKRSLPFSSVYYEFGYSEFLQTFSYKEFFKVSLSLGVNAP